jgi:ribosomal protein S18 acetylase RimI-like enzyme
VSLADTLSRVATYRKRHGLLATASRAADTVNRIFANRMVLFYFDFADEVPGEAELPSSVRLERKNNEVEICQPDLQEFINFWNPKLARQEMKNRFSQGASLWMLKVEGQVAGYGWTLRGRTIEPHFFGLGRNDAHLFDYYVAPSHRGRGLNPLLVNHILRSLAVEGGGRAFIEVAEWNHAQLSSLRKTPFRRLGRALKVTIGSRTIVQWDTDRASGHGFQDIVKNPPVGVAGEKARGVRDL